jgi:tetratricopeptide (TPR) repeat protein
MIAAAEEVPVRTAHAEWFLRRAERAPEGTDVAVIRLWFGYEPADLIGDLDNMREAIDWWLAKGEYDAMIRIVAATIRVFQSQGRYDEPDEWLRVALEHKAEMSAGGRTRCYSAWAEAAEIRGRFLVANERARAAIAEAPTPAEARGAYSLLVANMTWIDADEADRLLESAAEWTVALGPLADGYVGFARASVALARHDYARAIALLSRASYHAVHGIRPLELAVAYLLHGDPDRASVAVDEDAHRHDLQRWRDYYVPFIRGLIAAVRGDVADARAHLADAIASIKRWKIPLGLADGVLGYAVVRFHAGDYVRASELLAAVQTATRGGLRSPMSMGVYRHYIRAMRAASHQEGIAEARARGAAMTLDAAIARELQHGDA